MLLMTDKRTQGEIFAARREDLGLTQKALAAQLGLSHTMVWNVENGRGVISADETIRRAAEVLDVDPDELYAAASIIPPDLETTLRDFDAEAFGELRELLAIRALPGGGALVRAFLAGELGGEGRDQG